MLLQMIIEQISHSDCHVAALYNTYYLLNGTPPLPPYKDALELTGVLVGEPHYDGLVALLALEFQPLHSLRSIKCVGLIWARHRARGFVHSMAIKSFGDGKLLVCNSLEFGQPSAIVTVQEFRKSFQFVRNKCFKVSNL